MCKAYDTEICDGRPYLLPFSGKGEPGGQGQDAGIPGMAAASLCGSKREFHAGGFESVSGIPGTGPAETEASADTEKTLPGRDKVPLQKRIFSAGGHCPQKGQGTACPDYGNDWFYRDSNQ